MRVALVFCVLFSSTMAAVSMGWRDINSFALPNFMQIHQQRYKPSTIAYISRLPWPKHRRDDVRRRIGSQQKQKLVDVKNWAEEFKKMT